MLEVTLNAFAAELKHSYTSYLTNLGQAVRQQLMLASYHLCTQGYPEAFLNLSFDRRQQLQQEIRQLGNLAAQQLPSLTQGQLEFPVIDEDEEDEEYGEDEDEEYGEDDEDEDDEADDAIDDETLTDSHEDTQSQEKNVAASLSQSLKKHFPNSKVTVAKIILNLSSPGDMSNPISLLLWQQYIEGAIAQILRQVSRNTNRLLQSAEILPKKLPEPIMEAAATSSEAAAESIPGPPNLLNLVIEVDNEDKSQELAMTKLMAINLRLLEIEFADATISSGRQKIRNLLVQLNKLGKQYQKYQRERAVAEAEAAWRASWVENEG